MKKLPIYIVGCVLFVAGAVGILEFFRALNIAEAPPGFSGVYLGGWAGVGIIASILWCVFWAFAISFYELLAKKE